MIASNPCRLIFIQKGKCYGRLQTRTNIQLVRKSRSTLLYELQHRNFHNFLVIFKRWFPVLNDKRSASKQRGLTVLFCGGLMIHRLDLDDTLKVERSAVSLKSSQDIVLSGDVAYFPLNHYPGKKEKLPMP